MTVPRGSASVRLAVTRVDQSNGLDVVRGVFLARLIDACGQVRGEPVFVDGQLFQ